MNRNEDALPARHISVPFTYLGLLPGRDDDKDGIDTNLDVQNGGYVPLKGKQVVC